VQLRDKVERDWLMTEIEDRDMSANHGDAAGGAAASVRLTADIADQWSWAASVAKIPQISGIVISAASETDAVRVSASLRDGDQELGAAVLGEGDLRDVPRGIGCEGVRFRAGSDQPLAR
jgi:hypothetical protein